jgi:putative transposase
MGKDTTSQRGESTFGDHLEALVRDKIQEFIQDLLEEEVELWLGRSRYERTPGGAERQGRRNGYGKPRKIGLSGGTVEVRRPRVRDTAEKFTSKILPLFVRSTAQLRDTLPELYLHGLSLGDFERALRGLLGDGAPLSKSSLDRLRGKWKLEYDEWRQRSLSDLGITYLWADGVYVKAGLEKDKAALLVVIGAGSDGRKHLLALEAGYRESMDSWLSVFRDLAGRGVTKPRIVVMDGVPGAWSAAAQVWPEAAGQRCWNHKMVNVLDRLPKNRQPEAKVILQEIYGASSVKDADRVRERFATRFGQDYSKAVEILVTDWERLITFFSFPKDHWHHLRTTNVVESPFASARLRTGAAKRFKKVESATALIWKTLLVAEGHWRRLRSPELLKLVAKGIAFVDGNPLSSDLKKASSAPTETAAELEVAMI